MGVEEEDFIQQVAEAIESCMDIDAVTVPDDAKKCWVLTNDGERFCIAVAKYDGPALDLSAVDDDDDDEGSDDVAAVSDDDDDDDD